MNLRDMRAKTMPLNRRASATGGTMVARPSPQMARGRSSMFQRIGANLSSDAPSTPPLGATPSSASSAPRPDGSLLEVSSDAGPADAASSPPPAPTPVADEPCGLTPASLKHLKRQRDALAEEKTRLLEQLAELQKLLKEQKQRVAALQTQLEESEAEKAELKQEVAAAVEREEEQRSRADVAEAVNVKLEETLAEKEAEIERLRKALEEQRQLTQEVCEAAERRGRDAEAGLRVKELEEQVKLLEAENKKLQEDLRQQAAQHEEMRRNVAVAMAAAEKAMAMHAYHSNQVETLRSAKLSDAINQKVELHISVPRVTLSYNNAPPLLISAATALSEGRIRHFLETEVFPNFEPLWVRMDSLDKAPDGSSKKAYSTRMLDRLTAAVKAFVVRSQQAEGPESLGSGTGEEEEVTRSTGGGSRSSGSGAGGGSSDLKEADREQLLELLRSGNDSGLDDKLKAVLAARGRT